MYRARTAVPFLNKPRLQQIGQQSLSLSDPLVPAIIPRESILFCPARRCCRHHSISIAGSCCGGGGADSPGILGHHFEIVEGVPSRVLVGIVLVRSSSIADGHGHSAQLDKRLDLSIVGMVLVFHVGHLKLLFSGQFLQ